MPSPLVSFVIPCFNGHRFLERALASVRAQTFGEIEVVIVDDGSDDPATIAYLNALPPEIRVVRQTNKGLPGARNTGFHEARGEYVVPLDCDDWLEPSFLEAALAKLEECPDRAFAFAYLALEGEEAGVLRKRYNFFEQLFLNHIPYCILISKRIWEETGGYDETMRRGCEDWEFNVRLGARGHFGTEVRRPLFHYRVSASGMLQSLTTRLFSSPQPYVADTVGEGVRREARGGGFGKDPLDPGRRRAVGHHLQVSAAEGGLKAGGVAAHHHQLPAVGGEPLGERLAHPARGAGNQGNAVHVFS